MTSRAMLPTEASVDNDKISFNSAEYEMIDGRTSPVSVMEEGTYNSHLTMQEKSASRNTELRREYLNPVKRLS